MEKEQFVFVFCFFFCGMICTIFSMFICPDQVIQYFPHVIVLFSFFVYYLSDDKWLFLSTEKQPPHGMINIY